MTAKVIRMGRHSDFELNPDQVTELVSARNEAKKARDYEFANRARVVLLLGSGSKRVEAAKTCEVSESAVYLWQRRYKALGLKGLRDHYKPRPCRLDARQQAELQSLIEGGPESAGFDVGIWTSAMVVDIIKEKYGVAYSVSAVARLLHRLEFSFQLPQVQLSRADPEAQKEWKETVYPAILQRAAEEGGVVFFSETRQCSSSPERVAKRGQGWVKAPSSRANRAENL